MCNALIAKYFKTLRYGCGVVAFIVSIYLNPVLYEHMQKPLFPLTAQLKTIYRYMYKQMEKADL